jgi:hypothetical protein
MYNKEPDVVITKPNTLLASGITRSPLLNTPPPSNTNNWNWNDKWLEL